MGDNFQIKIAGIGLWGNLFLSSCSVEIFILQASHHHPRPIFILMLYFKQILLDKKYIYSAGFKIIFWHGSISNCWLIFFTFLLRTYIFLQVNSAPELCVLLDVKVCSLMAPCTPVISIAEVWLTASHSQLDLRKSGQALVCALGFRGELRSKRTHTKTRSQSLRGLIFRISSFLSLLWGKHSHLELNNQSSKPPRARVLMPGSEGGKGAPGSRINPESGIQSQMSSSVGRCGWYVLMMPPSLHLARSALCLMSKSPLGITDSFKRPEASAGVISKGSCGSSYEWLYCHIPGMRVHVEMCLPHLIRSTTQLFLWAFTAHYHLIREDCRLNSGTKNPL